MRQKMLHQKYPQYFQGLSLFPTSRILSPWGQETIRVGRHGEQDVSSPAAVGELPGREPRQAAVQAALVHPEPDRSAEDRRRVQALTGAAELHLVLQDQEGVGCEQALGRPAAQLLGCGHRGHQEQVQVGEAVLFLLSVPSLVIFVFDFRDLDEWDHWGKRPRHVKR